MLAYIALDPGQQTGYATFDEAGNITDMDYLVLNEVRTRFAEDIKENPTAVVAESWRLDPKRAMAFSWSPMPECRLLGWIEGVCWARGITYVEQAPGVKTAGYMHWGRKALPHSNPMNHAWDAVVHGREYLIKQGVLKH